MVATITNEPGARIADRFELRNAVGRRRRWLAKDLQSSTGELVSISFDDDEARARARYAKLEKAHRAQRRSVPEPIAIGAAGDSRWYLARAWVDELTLREKLAFGALAVTQWIPLVRALLQNLGALHYARVFHGGIDPSRVMAVSGTLLGVDRSANDGSIDDVDPTYRSPEQLRGEPDSSVVDLWSLGLITFEAIYGRSYFRSDTKWNVAQDVLTGPLVPPSERAIQLGLLRGAAGFDDFFAACVSRSSDRRFADADEAIQSFEVLVVSRYRHLLEQEPAPCLNVAPLDDGALGAGPPVPCLYAPQPCLKVAAKKPDSSETIPIPCLSPVRPKDMPKAVPCLSVAPRPPKVDAPEMVPTGEGGPYRTVFRAPTDHERAARRRRYAAYVGVAVTAALVALWFARRC